MKDLRPFLIKTLAFSAIIGVLTAILKYTGIITAIDDQWYWMLLFYFLLTMFIFSLLIKAFQQNTRKFLVIFLGMSISRMLLFTFIILIYAFLIQPNNISKLVSFILTLAIYYFVFTVWEVILIVPSVKNKQQKKQ